MRLILSRSRTTALGLGRRLCTAGAATVDAAADVDADDELSRPFVLSKTDLMELPCVRFPGRIHVVTDAESEKRVFHHLQKTRTLGFDTESRPTYRKGQERTPVTLVQLATDTEVVLYRVGPAASDAKKKTKRRRGKSAKQTNGFQQSLEAMRSGQWSPPPPYANLVRERYCTASGAVVPDDGLAAKAFTTLTRKELQKFAKLNGVKANMKSVSIAQQLEALVNGVLTSRLGAPADALDEGAPSTAKYGSLPPLLTRLLADPNVLKVGQSILGDAKLLHLDYGVKMAGCVDLYKCAQVMECKPASLRALSAHFTGARLAKAQQMSDWQQAKLTPAQIKYGAVDAWASLNVYVEMMRMANGAERMDQLDWPGVPCTAQQMLASLAPMALGDPGVEATAPKKKKKRKKKKKKSADAGADAGADASADAGADAGSASSSAEPAEP